MMNPKRGIYAVCLLAALSILGCKPEKAETSAPEPDTLVVFKDTTGVIARLETLYTGLFAYENGEERKVFPAEAFLSARIKDLWEQFPENELVYEANIWTGLQDFDRLVYLGARLDTVLADTALATIRFSAFRDDTRTAIIRMVRETQDSLRAWFVDDITHDHFSIAETAFRHIPDSIVRFHWDCGAYNTHEEDNFIELCYFSAGGWLADGYFWGTSDEFYSAREGFLPGFIVLRMHDISLRADTLSFYLDSRGQDYFSTPIPLSVRNSAKARKAGCTPWNQPSYYAFYDSIRYTAILRPDTLRVLKHKSSQPYFEDHPFLRKTFEEIDSIERCRADDVQLF